MQTETLTAVDVLFDVDGVWNIFPSPSEWGWQCAPTISKVIGFPITYSQDLIDRVHELVARPDVHAHWLTTWMERAPQDLCPALGIDGAEWPVLGEISYSLGKGPWWKLTAVQRHAEATDRRIVWIDDDLAFDEEACDWVRANDRVLGISPRTSVGLTAAHLDIIERFIETGEVPTDA